MNPKKVSTAIQQALVKHMSQYRPVHKHVPELEEELKHYFNSPSGRFVSDTYVESIPYYQTDTKTTLSSLATAAEGKSDSLILPETARLFTAYFTPNAAKDKLYPEKIHLYEHQAAAVRAVNEGHKHLLVCTGTGSGKTESFLIPLIDNIMRERKEKGSAYKQGVRAMILYPMNALVSDQLLRIRRIFKEAERHQIPYAKDVTFGIYTGELDTLAQEKPPLEMTPAEGEHREAASRILEAQHTADAVENGSVTTDGPPCTHPYLASSDVPRHEYTRRSEWLAPENGGKGPADILITNYAMLERLLLDPQQSNIFSETWRFIVLDEAHTYTGAQGTEISWLLRRLRNRLVSAEGKEEAKLTYLATSATLVDADNKDDLERLSEEFAQSLFDTTDSFSVQSGTPVVNTWPKGDAEGTGYSDLLKANGIDVEALELENPYVANFPSSLAEQTHRLMEMRSWFKKFHGKAELLHRDCALGDALSLGHTMVDIGLGEPVVDEQGEPVVDEQGEPVFEPFQLVFEHLPLAVGDMVRLLEEDERKKVICLSVDSRDRLQEQEAQAVIDSICHRSVEHESFRLQDSAGMTLMGMLLMHACTQLVVRKAQNEPCELSPLTWRVRLTEACVNDMREGLELLTQAEQDLQKLEDALCSEWSQLLGLPLESGESIASLITRYLLQHPHLSKLNTYIREQQDTPACWTTAAISRELFGERDDAQDEFDALARLITLSEHPQLRGKPVLNLRYHQVVNAPSSVNIWFSKDKETGEAHVHVPALQDPEAAEFEDESGKRHRLYRLGICYDCGHPYILGYCGSKAEGERRFGIDLVNGGAYSENRFLNRYKTDQSYFLQAFTWTEGHHSSDVEDDMSGENGAAELPCWLRFETGTVHWQETCPTEGAPSEYIKMKAYAYTQEATRQDENEQQKDTSQRITTCPACGAQSRRPGEWGIIGNYSMGTSTARFTALDTLVRNADPTFSHQSSPSQRRKVLTFSDSRAGAAAIATRYEQFSEQNLVLELLTQAFRRVQQNPEEAMLKLQTLCTHPNGEAFTLVLSGGTAAASAAVPAVSTSASSHGRKIVLSKKSSKARYKPTPPAPKPDGELIRVYDACDATKKQQIRACFKDSLLLLLPAFIDGLKKSGAFHLLNKEPKSGARFNEVDSAYLAALKVLRTTGTRWNDIFKNLELYSCANQRNTRRSNWEEYARLFREDKREEMAKSYFSRAYLYLFLHCKLDCSTISLRGGDYEQESMEALEGYSRGSKHLILKSRNEQPVSQVGGERPFIFIGTSRGKMRTLLQEIRKEYGEDAFSAENEVDIVSKLFAYMEAANILLRPSGAYYRLNLSDVRFRYTAAEPGEELEEEQPVSYRVEEHTAQLSKEVAQLYQRLFSNGDINILSSSTTFEMGVDLGDLNCVMLCNMPPYVANYKQRAGRAGRRAGASAYVLTFVGDAAHDAYYKNNPHELFFGKVTPPRIYGNKSFRAKHLRAVALHEFFCYLQTLPAASRPDWQTCGRFFCGELKGFPVGGGTSQRGELPEAGRDKVSAVSLLPQWVIEKNEEVQKRCLDIVKPETLDYSVAADLCLQLIGTRELHALPDDEGSHQNTRPFYEETLGMPSFEQVHFYQELSGTVLPEHGEEPDDNLWQSSLLRRYEGKHRWLHSYWKSNQQSRSARVPFLRYRQQETIMYLAHSRVLPTYGFPCELVSLELHENDAACGVELQRDLRMAIFEYAEGHQVDANKKVFTSAMPIQYIRLDGRRRYLPALGNTSVHYCPDCKTYELGGSEKCPTCREDRVRLRGVTPEGFLSEEAKAPRWSAANPSSKRYIDYIGGIDEEHPWNVRGTRLKGYASPSRTLLFLNDLREQKNSFADKFEVLYHVVHTDIVIWTDQSLLSDSETMEAWNCSYKEVSQTPRLHNAWRSAAQAIIKAASIEFGMLNREISGMYHPINYRPHIVLYDNSPGGSGAVLQLLHSDDNAQHCDDRSIAILRRALSLVESCPCTKEHSRQEAMLMPVSPEEFHADSRGRREHHACYRCLKSYENQREHETLDAYDAAVILRHLLGDASTTPDGSEASQPPVQVLEDTTNDSHSTELPKATPAVTSEQKITSETKESLTELSDIEKPASLQLTAAQQALWDKMRDGLVSAGDKIEVWHQGEKVVMSYLGVTESHIRCKQIGKNVERITPDQLIQLIH